jgi:glycosyltransferase involved in cell wall biosynthesis
MRIVVDLQGAQNGSRYRGIGRYSLAFTQALIQNRGSDEIIIVLSDLFPETIMDIRAIFEPKIGAQNIQVWSGLSNSYFLDPSNYFRRHASEFLREAFLESLKPDVVLVTSLFEGCGDNSITSIGKLDSGIFTAVIFYDLIPLLYDKEYLADSRVKEWYEEKITHLRRADLWLAISESTIKEGVRLVGLDVNRLINISAAVGPEFSPRSYPNEELINFNTRFGITRPFLLYSGATDPRKNVKGLIAAWATLPETLRASHQLALVGGMPSDHRYALEQYAKSKGIALSELVFSGRITDNDLLLFYRTCKAFILPSLHEGFGLPALEAMACGAPTIGSNCSSIPEVIDLPCALFDPTSPKDIASHIASVLTDESLRLLLSENGKKRAKFFSWDKSAKLALGKFKQLAASGALDNIKRTNVDNFFSATLIEKIASIPVRKVADADLIECAAAIARMTPRHDDRVFIYVDISELHRRDLGTGIQRVVRNIARNLLSIADPAYAVKLVYGTEDQPYRHASQYTFNLLKLDNTSSPTTDDIIEPRAGDIFLGLDFQDQIVAAKTQYYLSLRNLGVRVCFVIYDLLPVSLPGIFSKEVQANYLKWLCIVANQDAALCISNATANEFCRWRENHFGSDHSSILVNWFHLGADVEDSTPTEQKTSDILAQIPGLYKNVSFLTVGTIEPRKGHAQLLDAFEILWENGADLNLVIVGRQGWMVDELITRLSSHREFGKRLIWIDKADDECLKQLYINCSCLIAPSTGEGFGLPLIEAARYNMPLVVRDLLVFREIAGDSAFYFNGSKGDDLALAIENWLLMYKNNAHPKSKQMNWLTWNESARQLMKSLLAMFPRQQ